MLQICLHPISGALRYIKVRANLMLVTELAGVRRYVVGVDGGASKTIAFFGDDGGTVQGRGEAGSSNYHNIGVLAAQRAIKKAIVEAQRRVGLMGKRPEVAVVALAGIDSTKDKLVAQRLVRKARIARASLVVHDSIAALEAATRGRPGIIVISGTGCVAAGINSKGEYIRVSGWGYLFDDEGSGYDIGRRALRAAFRAFDGRGPSTKLVNMLKKKFRVRTLDDAIIKIYADGMTVHEVARLAPVVAKMASRDKVCRQILNDAGFALAEMACTVANRLRMTHIPVTVAIVGGAFKAGHYLTKPFAERIKKDCPLAHIVRPKVEPALGSFLLAREELQRHSGIRQQPGVSFLNILS